MNPRREQYIAEVTAGLKGDPELRRDVSAELGSHLDAAIEESRARGRGEDESLDDAVKAMGSPLTLAGDLVDANRRRMRLRGVVRLVVGALVIPAAVILAVWMTKASAERAAVALTLFNITTDPLAAKVPQWMTYEQAEQRITTRWGLNARDRVIVFGDRTRPTRTEREKALCDLEPGNRVFYANYVRFRLTDFQGKRLTLDEMLGDLRSGEKMDPDNAFYNYVAAGTMIDQAGEWISQGSGTNRTQSFVVRDTNLLDQAMAEFQRGAVKPFYRTYQADLAALRRSLLPPSENMTDELVKIGMAAGVILPQVSQQRNMARVSIQYARALLDGGRPDEARKTLTRLARFAEDLTRDSWCLIELLVANVVTETVRKQGVPILEQAGLRKEATEMRLKAEAMSAPVQSWRSHQRSSNSGRWGHAGILVALLLPALGDQDLSDAELAPGRHLDYIIAEQWTLMSVILVFLVLMFIWGVLALRWRRVKGMDSVPFLVLPDWRRGLSVIGVSVVLPILIYLLYTRCGDLAGREVNIARNMARVVAELAGVGVFILASSTWMTLRYVKGRCRDLGIPVPASRWRGLCAWLFVWRSDYGLYLGTAARSLIPTFAAAILLLGGVVQPWLAREETRWLRADTLITQGKDIGGFTSVETRLIVRLKKEILEAAKRGEP